MTNHAGNHFTAVYSNRDFLQSNNAMSHEEESAKTGNVEDLNRYLFRSRSDATNHFLDIIGLSQQLNDT